MTRYRVWISAEARLETDALPGNVRQRARRAIQELAEDPRPSHSKGLIAPESLDLELRRIRLDRWRIVYAIDEADHSIAVVAVRRRPPYRYEDLGDFVG